MPKSQILSDRELFQLTGPFQLDGYSKDRALELVGAACLSMLVEPGDRMAGALSKNLGNTIFLNLLIDGLQTSQVLAELNNSESLTTVREEFGDLESTISDSRQRWLPRLSKSRLVHLFSQSAALGLGLVTPSDSNWPRGLDDLQHSAPAMLFVEGSPLVLANLQQAVSIVGSRASTEYGKQVTHHLVRHLAEGKRSTVSGGAVGIDAHAHQSSIDNDIPTIAVMAGGLDRKYPKSNSAMFRNIELHGAVISELPPGVAPTRWRFLQRNRLIAAFTPTTVVIEAGVRSGSIRTANNALELDRELYAVPGSVLSSTSAGTNSLIADGKALALHDLSVFASAHVLVPPKIIETALAKRAHDAIRELGYPTRTEVARGAGLTDAELSIALLELSKANQLIDGRSSDGQVHYALRYGH
ncbi:unannotated protein [freshwater metagenome]|uniref:Unannotated protein n=1 Tax=freshwater metagenome TaxID=449393 RepID=A0A6J6JBK6_9ZZZZ|nr:DNA-protecting protein DprA [Actinomycetota bacterium]